MNYKDFLKYAGKTAATIACPPLGAALYFKKHKAGAALVGAVLSFVLNIRIISLGLEQKKVYDNPHVMVNYFQKDFSGYNDNIPRVISELFASPLTLYFDMHTGGETTLGHYHVEGKDVITFNNGKYQLNFDKKRVFRESNSSRDISVEQAGEQVKTCKKTLEKCLSEGNLFAARKAREKLENANNNLKNVTDYHTKINAEFQAVVDKMNSELETLAQTKN